MALVKKSKIARGATKAALPATTPPRAPAPAAKSNGRSAKPQPVHDTASERIAAATEQLASGLAQSAAATKQLGRSMEQIAAGAEEAAGASQEQTAEITRVVSSL